MVQYSGLRFWRNKSERNRAIERLIDLRSGLTETVSASKKTSFHLATWNIRDLGSPKFNPSPRMPESLLYIAEIISAFDLVAVQEVNANMAEFLKVMRLLGPHWDFIITDESGNDERLAFVYDTRKIQFRHVAGEIVLPPPRKGQLSPQFNRTPFLVAFQAGWFKFNICTVHILYGSDKDAVDRRREIADIAKFFTKRQNKDGATYILLGDFNILNPKDSTMTALLGNGFKVPPGVSRPTALASIHHYDQIALRTQNNLVEIADSGCFRWQDHVFREDDYPAYQPIMPTTTKTGKPG
jgi:endonuclease/exonuclease/phosphatase family metal-dependent hydrolase